MKTENSGFGKMNVDVKCRKMSDKAEKLNAVIYEGLVNAEKISPLFRQYIITKTKNPEHILLFRVGDFYEMFYNDALIAHKELGLTLTRKSAGNDIPDAPMCGVPRHVLDTYIKKFMDLGHSVAICEQSDNPTDKKLMTREITKIITPGTITDAELLDNDKSNFIGCIYLGDDGAAACYADVSAGLVYLYEYDSVNKKSLKENQKSEEAILSDLSKHRPVELLCSEKFTEVSEFTQFMKREFDYFPKVMREESFAVKGNEKVLTGQFDTDNIGDLGFSGTDTPDIKCVYALFSYVLKMQKIYSGRFTEIVRDNRKKYMVVDTNLMKNLELCETMLTKEKKGSLIGVIDKTKTSMGRRMLKRVIEYPLLNPAAIEDRLDAIEKIMKYPMEMGTLASLLSGVCDLERIITKASYCTITPKEMKYLGQSIRLFPDIKECLTAFSAKLMKNLCSAIDPLGDVSAIIENAISDDVSALMKDGGFIKKGFNEQLDMERELFQNTEKLAEKIVESEIEKTGIKNIKLGNSRNFGYYLEVSKGNIKDVPDYFLRRQTLTNYERYTTNELEKLQYDASHAKENVDKLEKEIFSEVRKYIAGKVSEMHKAAEAIAAADVILSLADTAYENDYVRPDIADDGIINIVDGRHPVIEQMAVDGFYVPNNTYLDMKDNRLEIITGPNMAGKSTYMRQTAIIVLMAHMGSFVPAKSAHICLVDRIFTRVGASDNLSAGRSTFMVEMNEVADILRYATKKSLVILDEVGRGTSTADGVAIARAVVEALATDKKLGCKTLFATHYHELISLEGEVPGVKNYSLPVIRAGEKIRFMHKIVEGGADESFGIDVARLAGVPEKVIDRARKILNDGSAENSAAVKNTSDQLSFSAYSKNEVINRLKQINPDELNGDEALFVLRELVKKANE